MRSKIFTLPVGCSVKRVRISETTGDDETTAAERAKAKGEGSSLLDELVRISIIEVDGTKVQKEVPYLPYEGWNSKTRTACLLAFKALNSLNDKEVKDFLDGAVDSAPDGYEVDGKSIEIGQPGTSALHGI